MRSVLQPVITDAHVLIDAIDLPNWPNWCERWREEHVHEHGRLIGPSVACIIAEESQYQPTRVIAAVDSRRCAQREAGAVRTGATAPPRRVPAHVRRWRAGQKTRRGSSRVVAASTEDAIPARVSVSSVR